MPAPFAAPEMNSRPRTRIAAPEMLPHGELLPHLICSLTFCRGGGGHEAGEHGDA